MDLGTIDGRPPFQIRGPQSPRIAGVVFVCRKHCFSGLLVERKLRRKRCHRIRKQCRWRRQERGKRTRQQKEQQREIVLGKHQSLLQFKVPGFRHCQPIDIFMDVSSNFLCQHGFVLRRHVRRRASHEGLYPELPAGLVLRCAIIADTAGSRTNRRGAQSRLSRSHPPRRFDLFRIATKLPWLSLRHLPGDRPERDHDEGFPEVSADTTGTQGRHILRLCRNGRVAECFGRHGSVLSGLSLSDFEFYRCRQLFQPNGHGR
mmetsp:Transcript_8910/g.18663  ORF Transcript_8910/g.18663 Transcript_8910/m.18663 type:complete len:260 (+) Transcript_8910:561-1340(+)